MARINPQVPADAIDDAVRKVLRTKSPSLVENNRRFHRFVTEGVPVEYRRDDLPGQAGRIVHDTVRLIDFTTPENNAKRSWLAWFLSLSHPICLRSEHAANGDARSPHSIAIADSQLAAGLFCCEQNGRFLEFAESRCQSDSSNELVGPLDRRECMLRISDTIRQTGTADGGILLDVHHGRMFCLNVVGAKILELVERGYDEPHIADEISKTYGADLAVVSADVHDFIENLQKHHILQATRSTGIV